MKSFILALCFSSMYAATITMSTQALPQQVILSFLDSNPNSGTCKVVVYESDGVTKVNDTNNALFTNSESCSRHTLTTIGNRVFAVIGKRGLNGVQRDLNGNMSSRSLAVNHDYIVKVTDSSNVTTQQAFTTDNLRWGRTFPDTPGFETNAPDRYAYPTLNWADGSAGAGTTADSIRVDPNTGLEFIRIVRGLHNNHSPEAVFSGVFGGTNWTNVNNVLNHSSGGPFASYANTGRDPIYIIISPDQTAYRPGGVNTPFVTPPYRRPGLLEDLEINVYGNATSTGTADDAKISLCLIPLFNGPGTETCANEWDLPLTTGAATVQSGPSSYPKWQFNGWNVGHFLTEDESSVPGSNDGGPTASVTNSVVTLSGSVTFATPFIPQFTTVGMPINIGGTWYHIGTLNSAQSFTLQEVGVNIAGPANWHLGSFAIRIRKKTAVNNAININAGFVGAFAYGVGYGANGIPDFCSRNTDTVSFAADGTTPITPTPGRLCQIGTSANERRLILFMETGETRYISNLYHVDWSSSGGSARIPFDSFDYQDPLTVWATDAAFSAPHHTALWKATYDKATCKFAAWNGNNYQFDHPPFPTPDNDCMVWTEVNVNGTTLQDAFAPLQSADPFWDVSLGVAVGDYQSFAGTYSTKYAFFGSSQHQDNMCWLGTVDTSTGTIMSFANSMNVPGMRYAGCHGTGVSYVDATRTWASWSNEPLGLKSDPTLWLGGTPMIQSVTAVSFDQGATWNANTFIDPVHAGTPPSYEGWPLFDNAVCHKNGQPVWTIDSDGHRCMDLTYVGTCSANTFGVTGNQCLQVKISDDRVCTLQESNGMADVTKWKCPWSKSYSGLSPAQSIIGLDTGNAGTYNSSWIGGNMTINEGDYVSRLNASMTSNNNYVDGQAGKMRVIKKINNGGNGAGGWILELQRWATCDNPTSDYNTTAVGFYDHTYLGATGNTYANGWYMNLISTGTCAGNAVWWDASQAISNSTPYYTIADATTVSHNTVGFAINSTNTPPYNTLQAGPGFARADVFPGIITNYNFTRYNIDQTSVANNWLKGLGPIEQYPSMGNWSVPITRQRALYYDFRHINPGTGTIVEDPVDIFPMTYTTETTGGRTNTWKVSIGSVLSTTNEYKSNWPIGYSTRGTYKDVSGPSSNLIDSNLFNLCTVYKTGVGECIPGKVGGTNAGEVYITTKNQALSHNSCISDSYVVSTPCVSYLGGPIGYAIQGDTNFSDVFGTRIRRLTMSMTGPAAQYQYSSPHMVSNGKWGLIVAGWPNLMKYDLLAYKIPYMPNEDGVDRSQFIPIPVSISGGFAKVRIAFGYDEYGTANQFYCTPRAEKCVTDSVITPFAFATSDSLTATSCSTGCTILVPSISGRVVYMQIEKSNDNYVTTFVEPLPPQGVK